jgi:NTP pyrophosphatase (non-canonical NTP hydrolase)
MHKFYLISGPQGSGKTMITSALEAAFFATGINCSIRDPASASEVTRAKENFSGTISVIYTTSEQITFTKDDPELVHIDLFNKEETHMLSKEEQVKLDILLGKYLKFTDTVAVYPEAGEKSIAELAYLGLGLAGEAGEAIGTAKKAFRRGYATESDKDKALDELGDVLFYWTRLCYAFGLSPSEVLQENVGKLSGRKESGTLKDR